jgi:hypothetical protein
MTITEAQQLKAGDTVTWTDPDDGLCSRTETITAIEIYAEDDEYFEDTMIHIDFADDGEVECFAAELSPGTLTGK